jgi:hypothetical protein
MRFARFAFDATPQGNGSVQGIQRREFLTWILKRDWIVMLLVRR